MTCVAHFKIGEIHFKWPELFHRGWIIIYIAHIALCKIFIITFSKSSLTPSSPADFGFELPAESDL